MMDKPRHARLAPQSSSTAGRGRHPKVSLKTTSKDKIEELMKHDTAGDPMTGVK